MTEPSTASVYEVAPGRVAQLMAATEGGEGGWQPEELDAILRHQLAAPLDWEATRAPRELAPASATACPAAATINTLDDLFHHPCPPVELLRLAKDFAKANREHPSGALPPAVATVVYFASIVAARARLGARITSLDDDAVRAGCEWVLAQSWVDGRTRELFGAAKRLLDMG
ncbi:MAG: hypothetical protein HYY24_27405 [Verrucomicrobia bacterium]|nr:hypothetical protein [Verrucomicrobiota bacterium]